MWHSNVARYISTRYADNRNGYQMTDIYGHPEKDVHILDQSCSHKGSLNMAYVPCHVPPPV